MTYRNPQDVLFETTASFTMLITGAAVAALVHQLIVLAAPLIESVLSTQMLIETGL